MDEYRMVKCYACGQERRGARIIRIHRLHQSQWDELETQEQRRSWWCAVGLIVSLILIGGIELLALGKPFSSVRGSNAVPWTFLIMVFSFFALIFLWKDLDSAPQLKKKFLEEHYGLKNESYEVIA